MVAAAEHAKASVCVAASACSLSGFFDKRLAHLGLRVFAKPHPKQNSRCFSTKQFF